MSKVGTTLFASPRERRLWVWTLIVLLAIYASLGLARTIADFLRENGLLQLSVVAITFVVLVPLAWQWVKKRPGWSEIGVALGIALAYWLTILRIENPAERTHLIEYGVVAALIHMALLERTQNGREVVMPAAVAVGATALLGLLDEGIQFILPNRIFDWQDVFFNAFAGFMVIVARLALAPVKRPGWRLWFLWLLTGAIGWGWSMDPSLFGLGSAYEIGASRLMLTIPPFPSVAVGVVVVGVLHWLILRRYLDRAIRWVVANLAAAVVGVLLLWLANLFDPDNGFVVAVVLHGTTAGLMQWLVLRQQLRQAGWWLLASTVGWLVAIPVGDLAGPPGWAAYVAITGTLLVVLLRHKEPDAAQNSSASAEIEPSQAGQ